MVDFPWHCGILTAWDSTVRCVVTADLTHVTPEYLLSASQSQIHNVTVYLHYTESEMASVKAPNVHVCRLVSNLSRVRLSTNLTVSAGSHLIKLCWVLPLFGFVYLDTFICVSLYCLSLTHLEGLYGAFRCMSWIPKFMALTGKSWVHFIFISFFSLVEILKKKKRIKIDTFYICYDFFVLSLQHF